MTARLERDEGADYRKVCARLGERHVSHITALGVLKASLRDDAKAASDLFWSGYAEYVRLGDLR